jgi:hypothetical protein
MAKQLYADPVGRTDIRVDGHCGCPPPEPPWLTWRVGEREVINPSPDDNAMAKRLGIDWSEYLIGDPVELGAEAFVDTYHIDSELGLYLFARAIEGL